MTSSFNLHALRRLVLLVLLAAGLAPAEADAAARQYHNSTFGYTVSLPAALEDFQSVTSPEGITLTSPGGRAMVEIFGSWNEAGNSLRAVVDRYKRELPQAEITYEWHGRNAAVLSGYQAGDIFYVRIAMSPDRSRAAVLSLIYAPEVKRQLDPIVSRLSTSLSIR